MVLPQLCFPQLERAGRGLGFGCGNLRREKSPTAVSVPGPAAGRGCAQAPGGLEEPLGQGTSVSVWVNGSNPVSGKV